MIRINLLPPEIVQKRRAERILGYIGIGAAGLAVLLVVVWGIAAYMVRNANVELQSKKDQAASLQKAAEAFAIFESKEADLAARRDVVTRALAGRVDWTRLFGELSLVLPSDTWLASIKVAEDSAPNFSVTGYALDPQDTPDEGHKSIASCLIRLTDLEQLRNVWLTSSEKDVGTFEPDTVVNFTISAEVVKPVAADQSAGTVPAPPSQ